MSVSGCSDSQGLIHTCHDHLLSVWGVKLISHCTPSAICGPNDDNPKAATGYLELFLKHTYNLNDLNNYFVFNYFYLITVLLLFNVRFPLV